MNIKNEAKWKQLIHDNHCGYNGGEKVSYKMLLADSPLDGHDLFYFESVILEATYGGQGDYDRFPDKGGIGIANVLLEEVKRLNVLVGVN